jgi:hypothetical protein
MFVAVRLLQLLFTYDYKDPNQGVTVIAAGVTLIGVLFTGTITFSGLLLKQLIDQRNTELAKRALQDKQTEQKRMQMETAMQVVRSLSLDNGQAASIPQCSGAVLVLAGLGETALALNLISALWPDGHISAGAAVSVIDDALHPNHAELHEQALMVMINNVERLDIAADQYEWPTRLNQWETELSLTNLETLRELLQRWANHRSLPTDSADFPAPMLRDVTSMLNTQAQVTQGAAEGPHQIPQRTV